MRVTKEHVFAMVFCLFLGGLVTKLSSPSLPSCDDESIERVLVKELKPSINVIRGNHLKIKGLAHAPGKTEGDEKIKVCTGVMSFIDNEGYQIYENFDYSITRSTVNEKTFEVNIGK